MARELLSMRQIKELLRLKHEHGLSGRQIARSCGLPVSTVGDYLKRAQDAGLSWPLSEEMTEAQLLEKLLGSAAPAVAPTKTLPDWKAIHQELRRKGVTLQLLWNEYHQIHPEGYAYSRFCERYREWEGTLDPVLRQVHVPGQKMFVDWAGQTVPIHNATDGSLSQGHLFVAVLGASNKTFAEAFANEQLPCWIAGHVHAYAFFGGVPSVTVPDNPKTAVVRACRYEPQLHRSYAEMAEHYIFVPRICHKPMRCIAAMRRWPSTTGRWCSRPGRASPETRRPWRPACRSPNGTSWPPCAINVSSVWLL